MGIRALSMVTFLSAVLVFPSASEPGGAPISAASVPETHIGEWHLDLSRTLSEHFREMSPQMGAEAIEPILAAVSTSTAAKESAVTMIFTESILTMVHGGFFFREEMPYRIIGGNSEHVVIEAFPVDDEPIISTVRFVDGGLAVSQEECADDPERCVRRKQRSMEKMRQRMLTHSQTAHGSEGADGSLTIEARTTSAFDGLLPAPQAQPEQFQLKWMYFKKR